MAMNNARDSGDAWFHGKITRENAAHLVTVSGHLDGYFLVRESLRMPGSYVLTMWADNTVHHFQIIGHGDGWFSVDNGPLFQGLDELIHHYQVKPDGLPKRLLDFVQGQPPPLSARKRVLTNLHKAVASNDIKTVRKFLSGPTSLTVGTVDSPNAEGQTPVHEATKRGFSEMVLLLVEQRPDLSLRDSKGCTALHLASQNGYADIIKILVENGQADVQERNTTTGWVALHEAAFRGHVECCKMLLSLNAPLRPRTPSPDEDTPRELAVRYKQDKVINLLDWVAHNYPKPRTNTSEWLHKVLDRNRAVEYLRQNGQIDGSFLVRPNSRKPGYYALTLVFKQMPYHYEIICESDRWYYIDDGPLFDSLSLCMDHYMMFPDGLPTLLRFPVSPSDNRISRTTNKAPFPGSLLFTQSQPVPPRPALPTPPSRHPHFSRPPVPLPSNGPYPPSNGPQANIPSFKSISTGSGAPSHPPPPPPSAASVSHTRQDPYSIVYIKEKSLTLGSELGQGEFGSVLKGTYRTPEGKVIDVAVKTLRVDAMGHGEKEFLREAKIMMGLNHPCIVQLIGVTQNKPLVLVQELIPYGALVDYLYDGKYPKPTIPTLKLWAAEIASGMMYLEKKRFVHRDLAARNILVASSHVVKISDFGLSRAVGANSDYYKASQGGRWPVKWYAPESINYGTFSHASDVWSYGVTLWEMFSYGEPPYGEMTGAEVLDFIENKHGRLEIPHNCPQSIYRLMLDCWSLEINQRPSFEQLYEYFNESEESRDIPHKELYQDPGKL